MLRVLINRIQIEIVHAQEICPRSLIFQTLKSGGLSEPAVCPAWFPATAGFPQPDVQDNYGSHHGKEHSNDRYDNHRDHHSRRLGWHGAWGGGGGHFKGVH